mgnify:CR=1 FL=1
MEEVVDRWMTLGYPWRMAKRKRPPRLLLTLSKPAEEWFRNEAKRLGISLAELFRRIIDEKREKKGG